MRSIFFALVVFVSACSSDSREWNTAREAAVDFCTPFCQWADKCGHADGDVESCIDGCVNGTVCGNEPNMEFNCTNEPIGTDAQITECLNDVNPASECPASFDIPDSCSGVFTTAW